MESRPVETNNGKEQFIHTSSRPVPRAPLWVSIYEEHLASLDGKRSGDMNRKCCLPYPAFLVEHCDNHTRPLTELRVSVEMYFYISDSILCQVKKQFYAQAIDFIDKDVSYR